MKKIIIMIVTIMMVMTMLAGCNMSMGLGNYTYDRVHIDTHNYSGCLTIEKWHDNSTGIEVETKEAGSIFLSEGMYMLIEDECPFCADDAEEN